MQRVDSGAGGHYLRSLMIDEQAIRSRFLAIKDQLNEKGRRMFVAAEKAAAGYGGTAAVCRATGVARSTIIRGARELQRGEQRLNALNPLADPSTLRIYSFIVVDRETYTLALENPNGRPIGSNLSLFDLFSFDVPGDSRLRLNFESLFHKYEGYIEAHTKSLLAKLNTRSGDIKAEIIDLLAAKLLNFVRNPFCVVKVLNSFPGVASYDPTDPALLADYRRIVTGRKPHQAHLCTQLGISDAQYIEWLRLLLMLLMPMAEGRPNFFEEIIKGLLVLLCHKFLCRITRWQQGHLGRARAISRAMAVRTEVIELGT